MSTKSTLIGRAILTLSVLPNSSASSMLSIAEAASPVSLYSTKAKPLCASVSKSSGTVISINRDKSLLQCPKTYL